MIKFMRLIVREREREDDRQKFENYVMYLIFLYLYSNQLTFKLIYKRSNKSNL